VAWQKDAKPETVHQRESALRIGVQSQRDCVHQREHARRDLNAPTGHRPPAQGWCVSAYLGSSFRQIINRNAVVANVARDGRTGIAATALRLEMICGR